MIVVRISLLIVMMIVISMNVVKIVCMLLRCNMAKNCMMSSPPQVLGVKFLVFIVCLKTLEVVYIALAHN